MGSRRGSQLIPDSIKTSADGKAIAEDQQEVGLSLVPFVEEQQDLELGGAVRMGRGMRQASTYA